MDNKLRLKRLKEMSYMLKNHNKLFHNIKFDMSDWIEPAPATKENACTMEGVCGSAACALGSAAVYAPFMKQGLKLKDLYPRYKGKGGNEAGEAFFGITADESGDLFMPEYYLGIDEIKPRDVAKKVDKLIKQYSAA